MLVGVQEWSCKNLFKQILVGEKNTLEQKRGGVKVKTWWCNKLLL